MKRTLIQLLMCASAFSAFAQLVPTNYRGAFAPAPAAQWTEGWTNFTPQATTYPVTTVDILGGEINTSTTWTKGNVYNLKGYVYITNGATLTIEPGTVIRSKDKSALVITRGSKIYANGTIAEPIVFTSNAGVGSRVKGDWGGVVICGAAQHNISTGVDAKVEGDISANHGGADDNDSSGVFRYVRIEYPGQALSTAANSEINGLSLYSVGRKTKIEYIQVSFSGDDSFEWFGGAVNMKYLVAFRGLDDDFDTDNGFRGTVQFGVGHRDPAAADASGSNGFESDNDATGSYNTPKTAPLFSNMTILGPKGYTATPDANFKRAAHIRRNSACSVINSILIGYTEAGLQIDGRRTTANVVNGLVNFTNNYVANNTADFSLVANSDTLGVNSSADLEGWALNSITKNEKGTDVTANLTNPFVLNATVDYRPKAVPVNFEGIEPTDYVGAFEPSPVAAWTNGWTNFIPQATTYPVTTVDVPGGNITVNTTWSKSNVYNLKGYVYVTNGATLTIEPGTLIRSKDKSALVITRGAKIFANGTVTEPIVFTSNAGVGSRVKGDWGGIVLCGNAVHNISSGVDAKVEGDITAFHGGFDDNDSSGVLRYVRIEFPGQALSTAANSEINGLSMYSVGRKTKIEYIQVSFSGDDSFEWFGGTVGCKHLVAFRALDDDFDTDNGFRGNVQFGVAQRDPAAADASGSNGFESDNDATGSSNFPQTAPQFYNMTIVGPKGYTATPDANFKRAAHIRRNSACSIFKSILIGFTESGILIDGRKTVANIKSGKLKLESNIVGNNTVDFALAGSSDTLGIASTADIAAWAATPEYHNLITLDVKGGLINPQVLNASVDFRPTGPNIPSAIDKDEYLEAQQVIVFPNPAVNYVEIALNSTFTNGTVNIQNSIGSVVASHVITGNTAKFDVSGLANGLYIVSTTNGSKVINKTLIISR